MQSPLLVINVSLLIACFSLIGCSSDSTSSSTDSGGSGGSAGSGSGGSHSSSTGGASAGSAGAGVTGDIGDRTDYTTLTLAEGAAYSSSDASVTKTDYSYTSSTADTPAVKVAPGGSLTLTHTKITKSGETANRENSGFYGFNSGALASSSSVASGYTAASAASLDMTDCTITTDASGANGVFAFGANSKVTLDHVTIETTGADNSRGVDATYGGTLTITNSLIDTKGSSCAALATDRYQGTSAPTINATNVRGTTAGSGSPGIYCTGTFNVSQSTLSASGSEAAVIEGKNSITLTDSALSGSAKWGVMIYQSMSGDSSQGTGSFTMTGGSLTNNYAEGPLFFICNTNATISLDDVSLTNSSEVLLIAGTNTAAVSTCGISSSNVNSSWSGQGGVVTFTAKDQTLEGEIKICDTLSSLSLTLTGSTLSSAINADNIGAKVSLTLDAESTWTVTGDSYLTSLTNHGTLTGSGKVYVDGTQVYPSN